MPRRTGKYKLAHTLKEHKGEVVGLSVHPSGQYLVSAATDGTWNFYDANNASLLASVSDEKARAGFTCVEFHPDGAPGARCQPTPVCRRSLLTSLPTGVYLGCGANDSVVHLYSAKQQKAVATFSEGALHSPAVVARN